MYRFISVVSVATVMACVPATDHIHSLGSAASHEGGADAPAVTLRLTLEHSAFPTVTGQPNTIVYVPSGFDRSRPLDVVVYLHGWNNCASNVLGPADDACAEGHPARSAHHLASQLEASNKNTVLIVPELAFEEESSSPGRFAEDGVFSAMMTDALTEAAPAIGSHSVRDIHQLIVVSHSGGYQAAAAILSKGGLEISEILLLDSLNGNYDEFDGWVTKNDAAKLFAASPPRRRFVSMYTEDGGTLAASVAMAERARGWFPDGDVLVDDRGAGELKDLRHGLIFKHVACGHEDLPRNYFRALLESSGLPDKSGTSVASR